MYKKKCIQPIYYLFLIYNQYGGRYNMEKTMNYNLNVLEERVINANNVSDLKKIKKQLSNISTSVICVGNGGSSVVSDFASKVLTEKNKCITLLREPRDLNYDKSVELFKELFICSYSGKNCGVETALKSKLEKNYLQQIMI